MRGSVVARLALALPLFASAACGSSDGVDAPSIAADPPGVPTGDPTTPDPGTAPATSPAAPTAEGPPYPVVLLHGMAGFTKLQNLPLDVVYFNGVVDDLADHGESEVYATVAPPYDSSEERVKALAPQIDAILAKTHKAKVNLIGHSQGGLDARILASPAGLGYGDRIASVTTIATPHRGSRVADLVLGLVSGVPKSTVDSVTSSVVGLLQKSVYQVQNDPHLYAQMQEMTEQYMSTVFNPKFVDDPRVTYGSYAGRTNFQDGILECDSAVYPDDPTHLDAAQPELAPTAIFLEQGIRRTNDGLVTVQSARWGTFLQCVPADHLKEVGLLQQGADPLSQFDHLAFFRSVVERLRQQGL